MRVEGWLKAFYLAIEKARSAHFVWGEHDCVLWGAAMADVVWGTDYFTQAKEKFPYTTETGAKEILDANGGITGLVETFIAPHVNAAQLTTGDLVLVKPATLNESFEALGVHDGQKLLIPGRTGLAFVPVRFAAYGWLIR